VANPAALLLTQFQSWNHPNVNADKARAEDIGAGMPKHMLAARHLDAINELLDQMEAAGHNIAIYRGRITDWRNILWCYPSGWASSSSGGIDQVALEHLETLSGMLGFFVPKATPDGSARLRTYLEDVETALREDELPSTLTMHVQHLVDHVRLCLSEYELYGDFELQDAIDRLTAAMVRAAGQSKNRERWRDLFNGFVTPFAVNVMSAIPASALTQFALGS
jgi:hypothetical protein